MTIAVTIAAGLSPGNDEAREWLEDELSKPRYGESEPGLLERFTTAVNDWLDSVLGSISGTSTPLPGFVAAIVAVALLALGLYLLRFVRRTPRARTDGSGSVLAGEALSADEFRRRARDAMARNDFDTAVRDAMRAIARRGFERTLLPDAPSLTAHEVADGLVASFPGETARLRSAAAVFDEVAYGGRHADHGQALAMIDLDDTLARTRPHTTAAPMVEAGA
ncbi:DUF4129 domain-containing protein [Gordonia sp. LSe1-13]|uniref:DUF4129 domain-containing protein n=1 Tax=Gordonia sesuvii TaxID=3116777 RepID=A0ABU7MFS6_9ACTN|nr:DUF4129 domain-containing protein [Gordonia sp. LSe1-13]